MTQPFATFWDRSPGRPKVPRSMSLTLPVTKSRKPSIIHPKARDRSLSLPTTINFDQANCLLFSLPAEIRIQIYELILNDTSSHADEEQLQLYYTHRLKPETTGSQPHKYAFILVCKRLTAEILPIAYATKTFQLVCKDQSQKKTRRGRSGLHLETLKENLKNSMRLGIQKKKTIQPGTPACLANANMVRRAGITNWDGHNLTISWDQILSIMMPFANLSRVEICLEFPWAFRREINGRGFCLDPVHVIIAMQLGKLRTEDHDSILGERNHPIACERIAKEQFDHAMSELPERYASIHPPNRQPEWAQMMQSQTLNVLGGINTGFLEAERGFREIWVEKVELRPMRQRS